MRMNRASPVPRCIRQRVSAASSTTVRAALLLVALSMAVPSLAATPNATHIVVDKSDRKLFVYAEQELVATYPVALGGNPLGHKTEEGDRRTPEGKYVLDYKNPHSAYHLSIHISYPNRNDREQARQRSVSPGGDIMIHGQPNDARLRQYLQSHPALDWTDGCIALSNEDMKALWDQVSVPVSIEITP